MRLDYFAPLDFRDEDNRLKVSREAACCAASCSHQQADPGALVQDVVTVAQHDSLPFASADIQSTIQSAVLYKRTHTGNWFHTFTEDTAQIFDQFCRYLGLCDGADFAQVRSYPAMPASSSSPAAEAGPGMQGTAVLTTDGGGPAGGNFGEVLACYGQNINVLGAEGPPVLVKRLAVGTGDHCNPNHCYECVPAALAGSGPLPPAAALLTRLPICWPASHACSLQHLLSVNCARQLRQAAVPAASLWSLPDLATAAGTLTAR